MTITRKKLIEVALPLKAINDACVREKSLRHGHPNTVHLWWARRPLAAARAVILSQLIDDPSEYVGTLRQDSKLRRRAELGLKAKRKVWEQAKALHDKAVDTGVDVPEPGAAPTLDEVLADLERQRLFQIIEQLVIWENTTNEQVIKSARDEIWNSWRRTCLDNVDDPLATECYDRHRLPPFHDPFAGGGALPLEAQRLGLEAHASDLNPVAVLINKAMIEIPPRFAGALPAHPDARKDPGFIQREWKGAQGLSADVRYYGQWMRDEAELRIGHLYPRLEVTAEMERERPDLQQYSGQKLTVIAWLWARTVKSPNPAFANVDVPLASTFMLSAKEGMEAYVEPIIGNGTYAFAVKAGKPIDEQTAKNGTKLSRGANFQCLMSGMPISPEHIYGEANAGRMGAKLMAIVAEGTRGRVFVAPTKEMEQIALTAQPSWKPDVAMPENPRWFSPPLYGLKAFGDLFTSRQLVALTTFSDLVQEVRALVQRDALSAGFRDDTKPLSDGGIGATAYAEAVSVYLAFAADKSAEGNTTLCVWSSLPSKLHIVSTFGRQALPMTWDYAESNVFADSSGNILRMCELVASVIERQCSTAAVLGESSQLDAAQLLLPTRRVFSTDPPYYDNIGYADLSDFFYVWLRRSLGVVFPDLFSTLAVPKAAELVATPYRHGGKEKAEAFFLTGMTQAMHRIVEQAHPAFPVTIYYAFKQTESDSDEGTASTGWDTFLAAVIQAGFGISGTWPMRTERAGGFRNKNQNALASSIILVCRRRDADAPVAARREFVAALRTELPLALAHLQRGNIAPVDLAQAAIGPGMAVYTRYSKVLDTEGNALTVREALALINQTLDEALADQEGDFDPDTRWALTWFDQIGFAAGEYGTAEQLSKSKNTSVTGMVEAGIIESKPGKVRLFAPQELPADWDPTTDTRLTAWEIVHHLIRVLGAGGESAAAVLVTKLGAQAEVARELAYRLYGISERRKRAQDAIAYNGLVQSWPEILRLAANSDSSEPQGSFL